MQTMEQRVITWSAWLGLAAVLSATFVGWAEFRSWQFSGLTSFSLFPLFGLLAFGMMWLHYIIGAAKLGAQDPPKLELWRKFTGWLVLAAILAHPGLFIYALYDAGLGLPPESYKSYVSEDLLFAVYMGVVAWLAFIGYEVIEKFKDRPAIKHRWWLVSIIDNTAMTLIFIHAWRLGADLQQPLFQSIWIFYGITLAYCIFRFQQRNIRKLRSHELAPSQ